MLCVGCFSSSAKLKLLAAAREKSAAPDGRHGAVRGAQQFLEKGTERANRVPPMQRVHVRRQRLCERVRVKEGDGAIVVVVADGAKRRRWVGCRGGRGGAADDCAGGAIDLAACQ